MLRCVLTFIIGLAPTIAFAGPWTRGPGSVYAKIGEGFFFADTFVDAAGNTIDAEYLGITTSLYAEVGIIDDLQLTLYLPHVVGRNTNDAGDRFLSVGGGDSSFGVQWSSPWLDFPHAMRAEFKVPFYDVAEPGGAQGSLFPNRGDGQLDVTAWLSAGGSFSTLYGFAEIGHRFRTETYIGDGSDLAYGDSLVFSGQIGWTAFAQIILAANLTGVMPYEEDTVTKGYLNLGPSIYAPIWHGLAIEASWDMTILAQNSSIGQAVSLGVSFSD